MRVKILNYLRQNTEYFSGENLSRAFGVSRTAVWKCIEELRLEGYRIDAVPHHGYKLSGIPDKLSSIEIQQALGSRKFGCVVHHFEEISSTMDEAFRLGMSGVPEGALVTAEYQLKGRGRMGRPWVSSRGKGVYFSLLLRPQLTLSDVSKLTLLSAVAISEAVEKHTGLRPLIKWPNDLLLGGRKIAGILTELRAEVDRVEFVVLGVGLNVNTSSKELPLVATSLKEVKGEEIGRVGLLKDILRSLEKRYLSLKKQGFDPVLEEWRRRSVTIGNHVRFEERGGLFSGVAIGLAKDGGLLIQLASGAIIKKMAGDITLEGNMKAL